MTSKLILLALCLSTLAACQSIPAERKNNCHCRTVAEASLSPIHSFQQERIFA